MSRTAPKPSASCQRRRRHHHEQPLRRARRVAARGARRRPPAARSRKRRRTRSPTTSSPTIKFLPVIPNPERIACAGINYRSHASETGREIPKQPSMFLRLHRHAGRPRGRDDPPDACRRISISRASLRWSSARAAATSRRSARSTMSPATPASSTAACATTRNSRSPRARIFPAPGRSAPGWSPPTKSPTRPS